MEKKLWERFLQKEKKTEFRIEILTKKKYDELYVTWNGYNNKFNSEIDKKGIS